MYIEYFTLKTASYIVYGIYLVYTLLIAGADRLIAFALYAAGRIRRIASASYIFSRRAAFVIRKGIHRHGTKLNTWARCSWDFRRQVVIENRMPIALPCGDDWE